MIVIVSSSARPGSVSGLAIEYAAVTEQVALSAGRMEGSGKLERAYTLAAEGFREEVEKVSAFGEEVVIFAATSSAPRETHYPAYGKIRGYYSRSGARSRRARLSALRSPALRSRRTKVRTLS